MNLELTKETIEYCRRHLTSEAYQDYMEAMKDHNPHAALKASDISGKIDSHMLELQKMIEEYEKSK